MQCTGLDDLAERLDVLAEQQKQAFDELRKQRGFVAETNAEVKLCQDAVNKLRFALQGDATDTESGLRMQLAVVRAELQKVQEDQDHFEGKLDGHTEAIWGGQNKPGFAQTLANYDKTTAVLQEQLKSAALWLKILLGVYTLLLSAILAVVLRKS